MINIHIFTLSALITTTSVSAQNLIANASFEDNNASETIFNMSNDEFNANVFNATAFGNAQEIDLMTFGNDFGIDPFDGNWNLALHLQNEGDVDAFSFTLNNSIIAGNEYDLSFWAAANTTFNQGNQPLEIGISSTADSFGTLVYNSGLLSFNQWSEHTTSFIAPITGNFLTVRSSGLPQTGTWAEIDAFSLTQVPAPGSLALFCTIAFIKTRRRKS